MCSNLTFSDKEKSMLVLSRKLNQDITLTTSSGDVIVVRIVETRNGAVRLGFIAERSVVISRNELIDVPGSRDSRSS